MRRTTFVSLELAPAATELVPSPLGHVNADCDDAVTLPFEEGAGAGTELVLLPPPPPHAVSASIAAISIANVVRLEFFNVFFL